MASPQSMRSIKQATDNWFMTDVERLTVIITTHSCKHFKAREEQELTPKNNLCTCVTLHTLHKHNDSVLMEHVIVYKELLRVLWRDNEYYYPLVFSSKHII